mgnify:CR=1 FL=1
MRQSLTTSRLPIPNRMRVLTPQFILKLRIDEAARCLDLGARGIKLHPRAQRFLLDDDRLAPVFKLAAERTEWPDRARRTNQTPSKKRAPRD